jgi:phage-related protein
MGNFIDSVKAVTKQIAPVVGTALNGIGKLIKEVVPVAMQYIPQIIGEFLPTIGEAAIGIVTSIGTAIFDNIDQILEWGQQMLDALLNGIINNTRNIANVVSTILTTFGNFVLENLPEIIMAGFSVLGALVGGLIEAIPELATAATRAIVELASYIINAENIEKIISLGGELINALSEGIENVVEELVGVGEKVVESIKEGISSAWKGLASWFNGLWNSLFGDREVNVTVNKGTPNPEANGVSYVPYDGFYAILHEGERVLTAEENRAYSRGATGNTSGVTIIQNIQSVPQTPVELAAATSAYFEQARWAI